MKKVVRIIKCLIVFIIPLSIQGCANPSGAEPVKYTVSFVTNGGSSVRAITDTKIDIEPVTTKDGYDFEGWFISETLTGNRVSFPYIIKEDIVFYAKWNEIVGESFTITFDSAGGIPVESYTGTILEEEPVTTRSKYNFIGWYIYHTLETEKVVFPYHITKNITFTAHWQQFNVTYDTDGGSAVDSLAGVEITKEPVTTKSGYSFQGWFLDEEFTGDRITFPYKLTKDITLYAKWELIGPTTFTVSFNTDGGTPITSYQGTIIAEEPVTDKSGYDFAGWFLDEEFSGERISFPYIIEEDVVFFAKWDEIASQAFTVTFDSAGGSPVAPFQGDVIDEEPETTRNNYNFVGWYIDDISETEKVIFPYLITENVTFIAHWEQFTVTYETKGGSAVNSFTGVEIATEPETDKPDYNFQGWFTDEGYSSERITFPYQLTEDITLYAKWDAIPPAAFTITFHSDGGTAVEAYTGAILEEEPLPTKNNYNFTGWYVHDASEIEKVVFPYEITANITFVAHWEQFIVTYDTDGGSAVSPFAGVKIATEPTTSKSGYRFQGWFIDEGFSGNRISFPYELSDDITLYAKWELIQEYDVTFNYNYEGAPTPFLIKTVDGKVSKPADPVRSGKDFNGWFVSANGGLTLLNIWNFNDAVSSNMTLYADWVDEKTVVGQLSAPVLKVSGYTVSWSSISQANGYDVCIETSAGAVVETLITNETSYTLANDNPGTYKISVRAKGNGETTVNSPYASRTIYYKILSNPTNISVNYTTSQIIWDSVLNATSYKVYAGTSSNNGTLMGTVETSSFNIPTTWEALTYYIKVEALADGYQTSIANYTFNNLKLRTP